MRPCAWAHELCLKRTVPGDLMPFKVNLCGCYTVERHQYKAKGPLGIKLVAVAKAGLHVSAASKHLLSQLTLYRDLHSSTFRLNLSTFCRIR